MGLIAGHFAFKGDASPHWRLFLTTDILGGYTKFSASSVDVALLWERHAVWPAAASVLLSVGGLFAGLLLCRQLA